VSGLPVRSPSTPRLMLGLLTLCVALVVLFTTVAVGSLAGARSELSGAAHSVGQLDRVHAIRTELLRADAAAAHAFLTGATGQDTSPADAFGHARVLLVAAAQAEPRDQEALAEVNRNLDAYVAALERARVAQGTPAGAAALAEAGDLLRTEVLPPLTALTTDNDRRVATQTGGFPGYLLVATGVLAVAALVALSMVFTIRFRRVLNLGILGAMVLVVGSLALSATVLLQAHEAVNDTARRSIPILSATAEARTDGYDAHAREAMAVIDRNADPAAQKPWDTAADDTRASLERPVLHRQEPELALRWAEYEQAHAVVRQHVLAGRWDQARAAAADSSRSFTVFDDAAGTVMAGTAQTVQQELLQPRGELLQGSVLSALAGLGAIACAVAGLRPRLREFR
jgi:hypothetical protein